MTALLIQTIAFTALLAGANTELAPCNMSSFGRNVFPRNCEQIMLVQPTSGVYNIWIDAIIGKPFQVFCENTLFGGGWIVFSQRKNGGLNFARNWSAYKNGFGNMSGEFFLGLEKLFVLTKYVKRKLLIALEDVDGRNLTGLYTQFEIGDETQRFKLHKLGKYTGDVGDFLRKNLGAPFVTKDTADRLGCSTTYRGGGWFNVCTPNLKKMKLFPWTDYGYSTNFSHWVKVMIK